MIPDCSSINVSCDPFIISFIFGIISILVILAYAMISKMRFMCDRG